MTEKQAWLRIARRLEQGEHSGLGLCVHLVSLDISSEMGKKMYRKIRRADKRKPTFYHDGLNGYYWSFKPSGIKARIRFCKKQAGLL